MQSCPPLHALHGAGKHDHIIAATVNHAESAPEPWNDVEDCWEIGAGDGRGRRGALLIALLLIRISRLPQLLPVNDGSFGFEYGSLQTEGQRHEHGRHKAGSIGRTMSRYATHPVMAHARGRVRTIHFPELILRLDCRFRSFPEPGLQCAAGRTPSNPARAHASIMTFLPRTNLSGMQQLLLFDAQEFLQSWIPPSV